MSVLVCLGVHKIGIDQGSVHFLSVKGVLTMKRVLKGLLGLVFASSLAGCAVGVGPYDGGYYGDGVISTGVYYDDSGYYYPGFYGSHYYYGSGHQAWRRGNHNVSHVYEDRVRGHGRHRGHGAHRGNHH